MVEVGDAMLQGQFNKALWSLDSALCSHLTSSRSNPEDTSTPTTGDPSLWQRGLCCFYTGHFREGARQFECDMAENGADVEEVVWHFLCRCGAQGFERAFSDGFLPLQKIPSSPPVPPMQEVLELFKGTGSVEKVLRSASSEDGTMMKSYNDTNALAYAHFYIGLYCEMRRELQEARHHLEKAATFENPDFIGKLMGVHLKLFSSKYPSWILQGSKNGGLGSRIIHGGWQLSKGHLTQQNVQDGHLGFVHIDNLLKTVDAGIRAFDCGDIYTGVEEIYGQFLRAHCLRGGSASDISFHTKFVPDLEAIQSRSMSREYVRGVVRRSLNRLGVETLSLVQFHWWDPSIPGSLEALSYLKELKNEGLIKNIGLTNFDAKMTREFVEAGIPVMSTQVQYSLLDRRVEESELAGLCEKHGIGILAYGVLAGGFLTDHWLGKDKPDSQGLSNRSLVKYLLIIEEFGGWSLFQRLLQCLRGIADRHSPVATEGVGVAITIAMVAISYVLGQRQVKGVIIGTHSDRHLKSTVAATSLRLTAADLADIDSVLAASVGPKGGVYELERKREGPHGAIMKYNLNQINKAAHLEELCRRYLHLHFEGHPVEATRTGYRQPGPTHQPHLLQNLISSHDSGFDFSQTALSSVKTCGYDHFVGPCSEHEIQEYCSKVDRLLEEAEHVEESTLSPDQLVDLSLVKSQLKLELVQWKEVQMYKKDPAFYLPLNSILYLLPTWGDETNPDPSVSSCHPGVAGMSVHERLLALLSRLRAIPSLLVQAHRNLTKPVSIFVETTLGICESFSNFLANDLLSVCNSLAESENATDVDFGPILAKIKSATAVAADCIKKYGSFLRSELLPKSSSSAGVGKDVYEKILRYSHFIESSEELLKLGENHFKKVKKDLECLAAEIDPTKSWREITSNTIHPMHPTASDLLGAYMTEIECSRSHMISHDLVSHLPKEERVVGFSTPSFLTPFSPVGDYLNPSPFARMGSKAGDTIPRTGHLMLHSIAARNLSDSEERKLLRGHDYTWIRVVSPHESYPGHHVQALRAQDHPRVLRQYHESILFYEGWGLYTEELAYETGFFERELSYQVEGSPGECQVVPADVSAKLTRLTQLRLQLWRAARIILDVKLNTSELSFEECREFLIEQTMFNRGASQGEVFMYASRPGYAPCYVSGFVMIMALRDEMRMRAESKGQTFQLKDFHDTLLSKGCVPFKLLSTLL